MLCMCSAAATRERQKSVATIEQIQKLGRCIGREFDPKRVLLFGSHACDSPTSDLDVDILVVMPHEGKGWRMATRRRSRVRPKFPIDLIVLPVSIDRYVCYSLVKEFIKQDIFAFILFPSPDFHNF